MRKKSLKNIESYLSRYLDGELSPDERRIVEARLQSEPDLQKTLDALRAASQEIQNTAAETESMNAVTLRLQQFVESFPHTQPVPAPDFMSPFWIGSWREWLSLPRKWKYAGMTASFVLLAILLVPTVLLPQFNEFQQRRYDVAGVSEVQTQGVRRGEAKERYQAGYDIERISEVNAGDAVLGRPMKKVSEGTESARSRIQTNESEVAAGAYIAKFGQSTDKGISPNSPPQGGRGGMGYMGMAMGLGETDIQEKDGAVDVHSTVPSIPDARKVIRNANMLIEVKELPAAQSAVERLVSESGGLTAQLTIREKENPPWAQYLLWIPAERLDSVLESLKKLGEVEHLESAIEDITEQYFDQETRIKNLQRQEERLLKLYERDTVKMEELLKVEQEIARVRTEVEQMQGRQRLWDRQIQYSTLSLNLRQKPELEPIVESEANDVFSPLRRAFQDTIAVIAYSCSLATTLIAWLFSLIVFLIPWVVAASILWFGWKWRARRRG